MWRLSDAKGALFTLRRFEVSMGDEHVQQQRTVYIVHLNPSQLPLSFLARPGRVVHDNHFGSSQQITSVFHNNHFGSLTTTTLVVHGKPLR